MDTFHLIPELGVKFPPNSVPLPQAVIHFTFQPTSYPSDLQLIGKQASGIQFCGDAWAGGGSQASLLPPPARASHYEWVQSGWSVTYHTSKQSSYPQHYTTSCPGISAIAHGFVYPRIALASCHGMPVL